MTLTNPNRFSTAGTSGTLGHITDAVDFPHTGLIKSLSLGMRGNYAVKTTNGFNITQAGSGNVIQVTSGFVFANGQLFECDAKNFADSVFTTSPANVSHLLVADVAEAQADRLKIIPHGANTANRIPDYADGNDVIIAVITYTSGFGSMTVQYLTTDKTSNALSIGYDSSGYAEMCKITAASGGTTVEVPTAGGDFIIDNTDADKKIVARLGTDTSATAFEVRNNSDAAKLTVLGTGATTIAGATTLSSIAACGSDTDKFLVSDSGVIKFRTGTEVASDIGALTGTFGIANNNILQANANLADNDFLRVDGTQIEGRTAAETRADIGAMGTGGGVFTGSVEMDTGETFRTTRLLTASVSASTTLSEATHAGKYVFVTGSSIVITIPDNQGVGVHFTIINNDGNGFTLRTGAGSSAGDNMNGAQTDIAVAARNGVTCISTGTDYVVLGV